MKIELEKEDWPNVFNDREFCLDYDENPSQCEKLIPTKENSPFCTVFGVELDIKVDSECIPYPVKCDKCKKAYAKAKQKKDECFSIYGTE